jgi:hypothetical protein
MDMKSLLQSKRGVSCNASQERRRLRLRTVPHGEKFPEIARNRALFGPKTMELLRVEPLQPCAETESNRVNAFCPGRSGIS